MNAKYNKVEKKNGKRVYEYKRFVFALSPEEHKLWKETYKKKGFDTITAMIRYQVNLLFNEIPNPQEMKQNNILDTKNLKNEIKLLRKENQKFKSEFLLLNRQMLKIMANGILNGKITKIATIQSKIIDLVKERSRTLNELVDILGISEIEVLNRLNDLVKKDIIMFSKDNMDWRMI